MIAPHRLDGRNVDRGMRLIPIWKRTLIALMMLSFAVFAVAEGPHHLGHHHLNCHIVRERDCAFCAAALSLHGLDTTPATPAPVIPEGREEPLSSGIRNARSLLPPNFHSIRPPPFLAIVPSGLHLSSSQERKTPS